MEKAKILLLDDEIDALNSMVQCFNRNKTGYTLLQTISPVVALDIAEKMQPDIIITDWRMPKMSGIDFIKEIKSNPKTAHILIIMTTAVLTSSKDLKIALEAGAIDYIQKPFDSIELLARTNAMLKFAETYKKSLENHKIIIEKERIIEKQKADILKFELDRRNAELLSNSIKLARYADINKQLIMKLKQLVKDNKNDLRNRIKSLISKYKQSTAEATWSTFFVTFEQTYPNFYENLNEKFPTLTANERRLCAFIRMNMTIKEISNLTMQSYESVRKARVRLRKKFNMKTNHDINKLLTTI